MYQFDLQWQGLDALVHDPVQQDTQAEDAARGRSFLRNRRKIGPAQGAESLSSLLDGLGGVLGGRGGGLSRGF